MGNNILDNSSIRNCTGCGICAVVCSKKALSIELNKNGFYRPIICTDKCVDCGICKHSCYKYDAEFRMSDSNLGCYAAVNKDKEQLVKSSSGGISRLLMEECLQQGYKVMACKYDSASEDAKSVIASSLDELDQFYGSKYFQSFTVDGFSSIINDRTTQKYAIFGTPCQIYAFSQTKLYKKNSSRYFLVDIFCHGCPSINLWKAQLSSMKKIISYHINDVKFRTKRYGWHEYCIDFNAKSKSIYSKKSNDPFFDLFFGADILNDACYDCKARSTMNYCDLRIGDFWGPRYELNDTGVSAVVVGSELGLNIFNKIKAKTYCELADFKEIVSFQSYGHTVSFNEERRNFLLNGLLECNNLSTVHAHYVKMFPLKARIKKTIKSVVKKMPIKMYFFIRKMLHSL